MKILVYIEPHPIRNYHEEFRDVGKMIVQALVRTGRGGRFDFRFFSNNIVADDIVAAIPTASLHVIRPTLEESTVMSEFDRTWNKPAIEEWLRLVRGDGSVSLTYTQMLERIHDEFPFDVIVMWSENGAVRSFGAARNMPVVNLEYGPTRSPLHKTFYMDAKGTNGNASVLNVSDELLASLDPLPPETWIAAQAGQGVDEDQVGLLDAGNTLRSQGADQLVPSAPYVFVPLQLADDLNTLVHSPFASPEEFLRAILPLYTRAGYRVVVKGHPGAAGRPYNLAREAEALLYARSFGENVVVVPRELPFASSINLIVQSSLVATINSSVGFEAILLGKKTALFGAAVYGRSGLLSYDASGDQSALEAWVTFLCGHYCLPLEALTDGDALIEGIFAISAEHHRGGKYDDAFWRDWIERMPQGVQWVTAGDANRPLYAVTEPGTGRTLAGFSGLSESRERAIFRRSGSVHVRATLHGSGIQAFATLQAGKFFGFVDELAEKDESTVIVRGWALESSGKRPPVQVFFCADDRIVSCHRTATERKDVFDHFDGMIAKRVGFTFEVDKKVLRDAGFCSLMLLSSDNSVQEVLLREGAIGSV